MLWLIAMNYFALLGQANALNLDAEALKLAYQNLAGQNHPDKGGDKADFNAIQRGYETLKQNDSRLKHFLEVNSIPFDSRGAVSNAVMDYFMPISELMQKIDQHQQAWHQAQSALNKALLTNQTITLQEKVEGILDQLETLETSIWLETVANETSPQTSATELQTAARDLTFLAKWKRELKQQYANLFSLA